ncbi:MAG: endolytic transglycosylase MltG [Solirubrobacterales bacterium]|nr:endolytic transglycosylase MltG [Solirubrobacterales bacterium]
MAEPRQRTAKEREAARLERERRRRSYVETPPPALSSEPSPPQLSIPPAEADSPVTDGHDPGRDGHEPEWAGQEPEWDRHEPEWAGQEPESGDDETEIASGTRRVGWRERSAVAAGDDPGLAGTPGNPPPPRPSPPPRGRRRSLLVRGAAIVALLLAAALIWFCVELFQPFHGSGHGRVTVIVPAHAGARQVGDLLSREGVVASGFFFYIRATLAGDRSKLLAGTYHLKLGMSYGQVLTALTTPPPAARVSEVTVIPGRTRAQVDALLRSQGVAGSYLADTRTSRLLSPSVYGAPRSTRSLEGFLFPDTYQLKEPISIPALVADQLSEFRKQFASVSLGYAASKHLTAYDVLIIGSMVEAEAQTAGDRPLIASVIYNRLAAGMPLQIDATTRYATGNYTRPLTQSELNSPSPYNTRIRAGLPPTPIDSPSLASIQAAAQPAHTRYLYFVVKPCGNGSHVFASSYSQFLADVQRYYSARAARGGNSPAKC